MPATILVALKIRTIHEPHIRSTPRQRDLDDLAPSAKTQIVMAELQSAFPLTQLRYTEILSTMLRVTTSSVWSYRSVVRESA